jgi:hypothetical protein
MAPAPAAAASEIRLKKKASVNVSDSDRPKLMNSGHVTCHSPGSGVAAAGSSSVKKGGLLGGSDEAFAMRGF